MKSILSIFKELKEDNRYLLEEVKKKDEQIAVLKAYKDELESANTMAGEAYESVRTVAGDLYNKLENCTSLCECVYKSLQYGDPNAFSSPDAYRCYMLNLIRPLLDNLKKEDE